MREVVVTAFDVIIPGKLFDARDAIIEALDANTPADAEVIIDNLDEGRILETDEVMSRGRRTIRQMGRHLDWYEARADHIEAARQTEGGRVKRPQGKIIGRLVYFKEPIPKLQMFHIVRQGQIILIVAGIEAPLVLGGRTTRQTWAIVPETRQMRREQERREEKQ